jgi:signal transduction histidine kinase/DNA-binding response OmpR family regulator
MAKKKLSSALAASKKTSSGKPGAKKTRLKGNGHTAVKPGSDNSVLETLIQNMPDAVLITNAEGRVIRHNRMFISFLGLDAGVPFLHENDAIKQLKDRVPAYFYQKILSENGPEFNCCEDIEFTHPDVKYVQFQINPIKDMDGAFFGKSWTIRDRTDFIQNQKSVEHASRDIEKRKFEFEKKNQDLNKAYREVEELNKSVTEANRLKSEFLSNMSHELRTPLNSILALSSILLARMDGDLNEEQEKQLKIIEKSGKNLLRLINDILDLSKIDSGRMDIFNAEYAVHDFAESLRMTILPMLKETDLEFHIDVEEGIDIHSTDENKLKQILLNLISNAIKFTPKGSVTLQVRRTKFDDVLEYAVKDTGIGIDPSNFETIFDPFRQIDGSATRKYGGTGLGLAVTKRLVELLGGKIGVESELGKGSTFKFILPAKHRGMDPSLLSDKEIAGMISKEKIQNELPEEQEIILDPNKKTIMVVDDDSEFLYVMNKYITEGHYQMIAVNKSETVMEKAIKYNPDVITLDIMMPKKDGWEILQELKRTSQTKDIPVAIVSMIDNKKLGYSLGTSDYIVKPVAQDMLLKRLNKLSEERGLKKILIVDDDLSQAELVEEILESDDFISEVATSGEMAIQLAKRKHYDLVILDLLMPQIDGFAVLKNLQSDALTEKMPVLVLTGKLLTQEDQKKLTGNHYYVFQKSMFSREKLLEQIHLILQKDVQ